MHPQFEPPDEIRRRLLDRRGRLHVFDRFHPPATALVVIDMQDGFLAPGAPSEVPAAREIVPAVNRLAATVRAAGGVVAWSQATFPDGAAHGGWPEFFRDLVPPAIAGAILDALSAGAPAHRLWSGLEVAAADLVFPKRRFSAFTRGASGLEAFLRQRGIDTLLVAGTMTNVCCESTARDAMQLGFRTVMVSDANAARSDAEHAATLVTFLQSFGDVLTIEEVSALLAGGAADIG